MVKPCVHVCCFLLILSVFSFQTHAAHKIDGVIGRTEYNGAAQQIIFKNHESNNNVSIAYLSLDLSEIDYSVYVGLKYVCDDVDLLLEQQNNNNASDEADTGMAGAIELYINGELCLTALLDGSFPDLDKNRFDAESCFSFVRDITGKPDTNNFAAEIRLGIKYWIPYNTVLGICIYDCSGYRSNCYTMPINPPPTESSAATQKETTTKAKQSTAKTTATTEKSTTTAVQQSAKTAETSSHTRPGEAAPVDFPKTTKRVITAASAGRVESYTTTLSNSETEKPSAKKPKETTDKLTVQTTRRTASAVDQKPESSSSMTIPTSEPSEPSATVTQIQTTVRSAAINPQKTVLLNRVHTGGVVAATILLTVAFTSSVFFGLRSRGVSATSETINNQNESEPDETEPDDF